MIIGRKGVGLIISYIADVTGLWYNVHMNKKGV